MTLKEARERYARIEALKDKCNKIWDSIPGTEVGTWEIVHSGADEEKLWDLMYVSICEYAAKTSNAILASLKEFGPQGDEGT
jgi:hypothetical protein